MPIPFLMPNTTPSKLEKLLLFLHKRREPTHAAALSEYLQCSRTTVLRLLKQATHRVVRIGQGAATRYLTTRALPIPLYQIDKQGSPQYIAAVVPTANGGYVVQTTPTTTWPWLLGENGWGYFPDLPYFFYDLRPQGFLGRQLASQLATQHDYPSNSNHWHNHHIAHYLLEIATDLPSNLIWGDAAWQRFQTQSMSIKLTPQAFPSQAEKVLAGEIIGSSAGGEQPKFTAYTERGHVIIKFSPVTTSPSSQRWRDLLIAEHTALQLLQQLGISTATTWLHLIDGQVFLECQRFDRHHVQGASAVISLAAVEAEFVGLGTTWIAIANALQQQGLLSALHQQQIVQAYCFGQWIANTDMHLHNLSLIPTATGFDLAPLYDMLPMHYAPTPHGALVTAPYQPKVQTGVSHAVITLAETFWAQLSQHEHVSDEFKQIALIQQAICQQHLLL